MRDSAERKVSTASRQSRIVVAESQTWLGRGCGSNWASIAAGYVIQRLPEMCTLLVQLSLDQMDVACAQPCRTLSISNSWISVDEIQSSRSLREHGWGSRGDGKKGLADVRRTCGALAGMMAAQLTDRFLVVGCIPARLSQGPASGFPNLVLPSPSALLAPSCAMSCVNDATQRVIGLHVVEWD